MTAQEIRSYDIDAPPLTALQSALLRANIRPLYTEEVRVFQAQRLEEEKAKLMLPREWWLLAIAIPLLAAAAVNFVLPAFYGHGILNVAELLAGGTLFLCAGWAWLRCWLKPLESVQSRMLLWRSYPVGNCHLGEVSMTPHFKGRGLETQTNLPHQVRKRMKAIAATGVTATFDVEQLDDDPFIRVSDRGEYYYFGVWDEKGFIS